ncbi:MAG: hypothetical protein IKU24_04820 [Clostridia bacterium]|nr:hypothetical protein [Clostridia bacterium]
MKKDISLWSLIGFAFTSLSGTLLHFLFDWTKESIVSAPFSAVNESTWEHMKLLFFPMFVFALVQYAFFRENKNFWCIKLIGTVCGLLLIPILFYTLGGVFGKTPDWLNISIFFISAAIVFLLETRLLKKNIAFCFSPALAFILILLIAFLFVFFTFKTPNLPIFQDPISKTFGYQK